MPSYTAYGLTIESDIPLPWLGGGNGDDAIDLFIRRTDLTAQRAELSTEPLHQRLSPDEAQLLWDGVGIFVIRNGNEILVDPAPEADERNVQIGILGPALAALLQQRGFLILHASAVVIHGTAVAFMGQSGWGKSTLAAALHIRGHHLLVDDIAAVRFEDGIPHVYAAFPQFKLWPDTVRALGADPAALPLIKPEIDKRAHRITEGFSAHASQPLGQIFVLAWGDEVAFEPLSSREAFLSLASHSYGIHWLHDLSGPAYFQTRAELARSVSVKRLVRPADLGRLAEVLALVDEEVACGPQPT